MRSSKLVILVFIFFAGFTSLSACSEVLQQKPEPAQPALPANVVNYIQKEPLKPKDPMAAAPAEIKFNSSTLKGDEIQFNYKTRTIIKSKNSKLIKS